jgi:DNA-binding response OmpR family regulator
VGGDQLCHQFEIPAGELDGAVILNLSARLKALEHAQATIIEHLVMIRATMRARQDSAAAPKETRLSDALARIEELEIRLEDALAPAEPLPDGLERTMSPIRRKLYALLKKKSIDNPSGFVHKDTIINALYGMSDDVPNTKALHVHIFHLRRKLPPHERIECVWGRGWRLVAESRVTPLLRLPLAPGAQLQAS